MPTRTDTSLVRMAIIADLIKGSKVPLGRTAVMKLCFFLQELRGLPLGYSFRIYTYGPYDSQVLEDLKVAEGRGAVQSKPFDFKGKTGVALSVGEKVDRVLAPVKEFIEEKQSDIDWVLSEFGSNSASDLEVQSTVIFVDRDLRSKSRVSVQEMASKVHSVKPHHKFEKIKVEVLALRDKGLLISVA